MGFGQPMPDPRGPLTRRSHEQRGCGRRLGEGTEAAAQVVAFIVAGSIFIAASLAVVFAGRGVAPDAEPSQAEAKRLDAQSLLAVLAGSQGSGWEGGADSVDRLGLGSTDGSALDLDHVQLMSGQLAADPGNGLVDHEEALVSLGLDPAKEAFHLAIRGTGSIQQSGGIAYPAYRVALIADWTALPSVSVPLELPSTMEAAAQGALDSYQSEMAQTDRALLAQLGLTFRDDVFVGTGSPAVQVTLPGPDPPLLQHLGLTLLEGDVYPDVKSHLAAVLPSRLAEYDLLVIGTGVSHNSLTSDAVKGGIEDWVHGGGILMVMGSSHASSNWLQPLFHIDLQADAGLIAPDPGHHMLGTPNALAWSQYPHDALAWDLGVLEPGFDQVLTGDNGAVLAVSEPGQIGAGRVLLTTVNLRGITTVLGEGQAVDFLTNALVAWTESVQLELDVHLGAPVPTDRPVAYAQRQAVVVVDDAVVPVDLQLWLWRVG